MFINDVNIFVGYEKLVNSGAHCPGTLWKDSNLVGLISTSPLFSTVVFSTVSFSTVSISARLSEERKRLTKCYKAASNSLDNNLQGLSLLSHLLCQHLLSPRGQHLFCFPSPATLYDLHTFDMMCHGHIFTQCHSSVIIMQIRAIHTMLGTQTSKQWSWSSEKNVIM